MIWFLICAGILIGIDIYLRSGWRVYPNLIQMWWTGEVSCFPWCGEVRSSWEAFWCRVSEDWARERMRKRLVGSEELEGKGEFVGGWGIIRLRLALDEYSEFPGILAPFLFACGWDASFQILTFNFLPFESINLPARLRKRCWEIQYVLVKKIYRYRILFLSTCLLHNSPQIATHFAYDSEQSFTLRRV